MPGLVQVDGAVASILILWDTDMGADGAVECCTAGRPWSNPRSALYAGSYRLLPLEKFNRLLQPFGKVHLDLPPKLLFDS